MGYDTSMKSNVLYMVNRCSRWFRWNSNNTILKRQLSYYDESVSDQHNGGVNMTPDKWWRRCYLNIVNPIPTG